MRTEIRGRVAISVLESPLAASSAISHSRRVRRIARGSAVRSSAGVRAPSHSAASRTLRARSRRARARPAVGGERDGGLPGGLEGRPPDHCAGRCVRRAHGGVAAGEPRQRRWCSAARSYAGQNERASPLRMMRRTCAETSQVADDALARAMSTSPRPQADMTRPPMARPARDAFAGHDELVVLAQRCREGRSSAPANPCRRVGASSQWRSRGSPWDGCRTCGGCGGHTRAGRCLGW